MWWRTKIDFLIIIELAIEVCTLDIDLVGMSTVTSSKGKDDMNRQELAHGSKGLIRVVVGSINLSETLSNETGTVAGDAVLR